MTHDDRTNEPRCATCECVLPGPGAICHVCDVEAHFEGVLRTAPPLFRRLRDEALPQRAAHRAS